MDPFSIFMLVAGGMDVFKGYMQYSAAQSKLEAINLSSKEQQIQIQQKQLATADLMEKTLQRQTAQATVRGIALSSPSFNAIQRDTINQGSRQLRNLETDESLVEANKRIERESVKDSLYAQIFGDTAEFASSFAKLKGV